MCNLAPDEEDICVEGATLDWLLRALRIAACMNQSLQALAATFPARVKCVNVSWNDVCQQVTSMGLVSVESSNDVVLSPMGHLLTSISLPFQLGLFLLVSLMLQNTNQMWQCAVCKVVSDP